METGLQIEQITEQTNYLLSEHLYTRMDPQKFVDWAVNLLQRGFETESILILASLGQYPREEIEKYFWKCVNELKLDLKKPDFELIENFAIHIAKSVVNKELEPEKGLRIMNDIVRESEYSSRYIQFYNLDEDIDCLNYGDNTIFNSFDKTDNIDEIIIEEFRLFLRAEQMKLDDEYQELSYCLICKTANKPTLKPKKSWIGKVKYNYWVCSNCGSQKLEQFTSQKGKNLIMNELENPAKKPNK